MTPSALDQRTGARARRRAQHDALLRRKLATPSRQHVTVVVLVAVCVLITVAVIWKAMTQ